MTCRRGDPARRPVGVLPASPPCRGEAPRSIELYSQSVRYVGRWLTRHAVARGESPAVARPRRRRLGSPLCWTSVRSCSPAHASRGSWGRGVGSATMIGPRIDGSRGTGALPAGSARREGPTIPVGTREDASVRQPATDLSTRQRPGARRRPSSGAPGRRIRQGSRSAPAGPGHADGPDPCRRGRGERGGRRLRPRRPHRRRSAPRPCRRRTARRRAWRRGHPA
jgi:hypothetical protein